jgi:hypothetical protein
LYKGRSPISTIEQSRPSFLIAQIDRAILRLKLPSRRLPTMIAIL